MPEFLLELLSEEIPARMQARAAEDLKRLVTEGLKVAGLTFDTARAFVTPRRLALVVDGLPEKQPDVSGERRGPRVDAPEKAVQGFLGSVGLALDQVETRETAKGAFYFAVIEKKGRATAEVLPEIIRDTLWQFPWPKSMRWERRPFRWVRPLHDILVVFDNAVLDFARFSHGIAGLVLPPAQFGNVTRGHPFLAPGEITVKTFADYEAKLREAKVILDPKERRAAIVTQAEKLAKAEGLMLKPDEALLNEVAGLVEWPVALIGRIGEEFMELPPEVLTTAMRAHQKYFALLDKDGRLAPRFIVVSNIETADNGAAIVAGNERVLRARLADARFFWDQDRRATLESRVARLEQIVFHGRLGTLGEKIGRVRELARRLVEAGFIPGADSASAERAALLAKADLVTDMVGEFPELQGVMGRYYALNDAEAPEVAQAIAEHYAPLGPHDACPKAPVSVAVALADKIDTLVGFFAIDEKPTGSRDPFALRRAALGVIRLIIENGLRMLLLRAFAGSFDLYLARLQEEEQEYSPAVATDLLAFFADRLKVHLREKGVRHDLISAVFALTGENDLVRLLARVDALQHFLETEDGASLLVAYRRAANIIRIEEKRDATSYDGAVEPGRLVQDEEKALHDKLDEVAEPIADALGREKFVDAMVRLAELRSIVDAFFDHVTVNCGEANLRKNRLFLLSRIREAMERVADFSKIEG